MTWSGYVLAGGRSSRMGRDKALLPFRGGALAEVVAREVAQAAGSATLVGHTTMGGIPDRHPGEGPLGGILTVLHHTSSDWNLIVACDMPEVSAKFLKRLMTEAERNSAAERSTPAIVLPYGANGRSEPLCAVYHRRSLAGLQSAFDGGIRKVKAAMEGLAVARLDFTEVGIFQNVNTPGDWSGYAAKRP